MSSPQPEADPGGRLVDGPASEVVAEAVELAVRAPSIHNTQPWQWRLTSSALDLYTDRTRQLQAADKSGRMLLISCGAALHHLTVAMAARGWRSKVVRLPDPRIPSLLASISFEAAPPTEHMTAWADAISRRRSDRRTMSSWEVPSSHVRTLVTLAAERGVVAQPLTNATDEHLWNALTRQVAVKRQGNRAYESELSHWAGVNSDAGEGVPEANMVSAPTPGRDRSVQDRFPAGTLRGGAEAGEDASSAALLLCTSSDDPLSRLRAGEALSVVLLEATRLGLATRLDSQVVEDETTRAQLEEQLLDGARSPQIVVHVGWAAETGPVPPSPRRQTEHVLKVTEAPSMSQQLAEPVPPPHPYIKGESS